MILIRLGNENLEGFENVISPEDLKEADFAVGAVEDERAVGAAAFQILDETDSLELSYIFVDPDERRKGTGRFLLEETVKELEARAVFAGFPESDELVDFFGKTGFSLAADGDCYEIPARTFIDSPVVSRLLESTKTDGVTTLDELSDTMKRALDSEIRKGGFPNSVLKDSYYGPLSFVYADADSNSTAACLLCSRQDNDVVVELLFSSAGDVSTMHKLFCAFGKALLKDEFADATIHLFTDEQSVADTISTLTDNAAEPSSRMIFAMLENENGNNEE